MDAECSTTVWLCVPAADVSLGMRMTLATCSISAFIIGHFYLQLWLLVFYPLSLGLLPMFGVEVGNHFFLFRN